MSAIYNHQGFEQDPRDAIDENATALSTTARRGERSAGYSGLRVDSDGYDRDGAWYPQYDGGGQDG